MIEDFKTKKEVAADGTLERPIVDSAMSREETLRPNPNFEISQEIFEQQVLINVVYKSFDGKFHQGQLVVHRDLEADIHDLFALIREIDFPVERAVPIVKYDFSDDASMNDNNSSGFNPRYKTGKTELSNHGLGRAIDINPKQNPYIKGDQVEPLGAVYNLEIPGTIGPDHPIVKFLVARGWEWGGDWTSLKDYQHFEKTEKPKE